MLFLCLPSGMTLQAGKPKNNVRYFYRIELAMDSSGNVSIWTSVRYPELCQLWPALRNQANHLLKLMFAFSQEMVTSISRGIGVQIKENSKKYTWGSKHRMQLFCLGCEWFKMLTTAIVLWTRFAGEVDHCELPWLRIWPTVLNYALYSSSCKEKAYFHGSPLILILF